MGIPTAILQYLIRCRIQADRVESRTKVDSAAALGAVELSMAHISGHDRSQMFLLPEAVDDYVDTDNPVRFIDAFVDELDLTAAGFVRVEPKAMGRPGYAPADLLKLYIYGYLNRVRVEPEAGVGMSSQTSNIPWGGG